MVCRRVVLAGGEVVAVAVLPYTFTRASLVLAHGVFHPFVPCPCEKKKTHDQRMANAPHGLNDPHPHTSWFEPSRPPASQRARFRKKKKTGTYARPMGPTACSEMR